MKNMTWKKRKIERLPSFKRKKKRINFFKKIFSFIFFFLILVCLFSIFVYFWIAKDLPDPNKLIEREIRQSTKIYDREGKTVLYEIFTDQRRTLVELHQISPYLIHATIAAEDKYFYEHKGFSFKSILRALIMNILKGKKIQGGSTITQQLIKNAILKPEKTYARKLRELILAYQIEKKFSKDEILKMYLNEIPYGSNAYGVEAASQIYFGKKASELTLDEAALLAALPKAPSYYSPYGENKDKLIARRNYILKEMLDLGFILKEEYEKAKETDTLKKIRPKKERMIAPHFVMYVKDQLIEKYGHRMVEQGGLKVITTLDLKKQKIAEEAILKNEENLKKFGATNASLVAIDVKTGEILAMVGSKDYFDESIDGYVNVALSPRQPGSSFKPIIYAKLFEKGYTPETILFDVVTNFGPDGSGKDYIPKDYDEKERGPITIRKALAGSLNIPAVKALYLAGLDNVLDLAEKMGYTTFKDRSRFGLAIVLGGGEVKLLEHTAAFSIFAREGIKIPISSILRVEDANGKVLEEKKEVVPERVLDEEVCRKINDILSDNSARAFIFGEKNYLTLPNRPVAAKTGTTQNWRDAWTIGYTPSLVAGVWVGNSSGEEMKKGADGSKLAAPIWNYFMREALKDAPVEEFTPPKPDIVDKPILKGEIPEIVVKIDKASGKLATDLTPLSFIVEKKYKIYHSILHYVDKDNPRGEAPTNPEKDPMYLRWEEAIKDWIRRNKIAVELPPTEYDDLHTLANRPKIQINYPLNGAVISSNILSISVLAEAPRGVREVKGFIDTFPFDKVYNYPYNLSLNTTGLSPGYHKITVYACDDIDNCQSSSININLLQNFRPTIFFLSPKNNENIYLESFPYPISLSLPIVKIKEINLYFRKLNTLEKKLIAKITSPDQFRINIDWLDSFEAGQYELFTEAFDINNLPIESEKIIVNIY
jgi:1A family penicillin-binding protein